MPPRNVDERRFYASDRSPIASSVHDGTSSRTLPSSRNTVLGSAVDEALAARLSGSLAEVVTRARVATLRRRDARCGAVDHGVEGMRSALHHDVDASGSSTPAPQRRVARAPRSAVGDRRPLDLRGRVARPRHDVAQHIERAAARLPIVDPGDA